MNKFLAAIYRGDKYSLDTYITQRTSKDRHEITDALRILAADTDLDPNVRTQHVQCLLFAGKY